jgi:hypothetical protein
MRCATVRKRLSDDLDGTVPSGRKPRLEAHLRTCASCRGYRQRLDRIQAAVRPPAEPAAESWASFERSVASRLEPRGDEGRGDVGAPFAARRRWAWAAAAVLILAGAGIWYSLRRPVTEPLEVWASFDEAFDPLLGAAEADPELAGRVDREITASIEEMTPASDSDADAAVLLSSDPLFWEGLSDDELRGVVAELETDLGRGGPQ